MHKISVVVLATILAANTAYAESERLSGDPKDEGFFIYAGLDAYSKSNIKINIADLVSDSVSYHGHFGNYSIGAGYNTGAFALSANMAGFDIDDFRMQNLTARLELPILPFETTPFIMGELGIGHISYDDELLDISELAFTYGLGLGARIWLYDGLSLKVNWLHTWARFDFDALDVPTTLKGRRHAVTIGLEYIF